MVDIVIINWNSGEYLSQCIDSIFIEENISLLGTVYIIDNNSKDDSLKRIAAREKLEIVINDENLGFAKGCNQGFRKCKSEYVLLLNPDAQLLNHTLTDCSDFLALNNAVTILGCQLVNEMSEITPSCSRFPSPFGFFKDALGLPKLAPSIFTPGIVMNDFDHKSSRFVDQVMGAFMFMRTSLFQKVGYFDEQFFVYFEEVDFSKRIAEIGERSYFNSDIRAIHIGEGTTKSVKAFRLYLSLQSRLKYARKHFSQMGYWTTWVSTFLIEPFSRILFLIFKGKIKEVPAVFKGYGMLVAKK